MKLHTHGLWSGIYLAIVGLAGVSTPALAQSCTPAPSGLVSWWRFEFSLRDNWGSNDGAGNQSVVPFGVGKVGRALAAIQYIVPIFVQDSPSLHFSNALTIEAWVEPYGYLHPYQNTIVSKGSFSLVLTNYGFVSFSIAGLGASASVTTPQAIPQNVWTFLVATYDGTALRIYTNGQLAAESAFSAPISPDDAYLGTGGVAYPPPYFGSPPVWAFYGLIDEVSLYSRSISPGEIQSIYNSDFLGKCLVPPTITAQPVSQSVPQNEDPGFSVSVAGSRPLQYQWRYNGSPLPGATNATLVLEKVQPAQAGFYSVVVSNALGAVTSASGDLKVLAPPRCAVAPSNMISWWPAGGDRGVDVVDGNDARFVTTGAVTAGKVGVAFVCDPYSGFNGWLVSNSTWLNFGSNAHFSVEGWIKAVPPGINFRLSYPCPNVPILEKRTASTASGVGYSLSLKNGRLAFWLGTNSPLAISNSVMFISSGPDLRDGRFHHVAATLNRALNDGGNLYVDGQLVLTFNPTTLSGDLSNSADLFLGGTRTSGSGGYYGLIDEMTICDRALSASEVQAIAGAGSAGKCRVRPFIITQPNNRVVTVGSNTTFLVVAAGTPNLRYQWLKGGGPITGATNSTLFLTNVQFTSAGLYSVRVTNGFGSITSSNAELVVQPFNNPQVSELPPGVLRCDFKDGQMHLVHVGVPGQRYLVEASTNLTTWTVLGPATDLGDGTFEFVDPAWNSLEACFYRIVPDSASRP